MVKYNIFGEEITENSVITLVSKPSKQPKKEKPIKKLVNSIRDSACCADCGWNTYPRLLKFHHTEIGTEKNRPGRRGRTKQLTECATPEEVKEELKKGVFLCPTCHDIRHYNKETKKLEYHNPNLR